MTATQKQQIEHLRLNGESYTSIADVLNLSANTVKSFCQRNDLGVKSRGKKKQICEQCKKTMRASQQTSRRFCSDDCRMTWWKAHPERRNRKTVYKFNCPVCHKPFTAYGNANRKYCSRKCYGKSKAVRHD